jgi:CPA1 family monovalent cation:H+ antiporter
LLNDGTAMVFFMLFLELAKGNTSSSVDVAMNFVRIAIGGPILGILVGFLTSFWLKKVVRDDLLTANITFVSCYLCFYIA